LYVSQTAIDVTKKRLGLAAEQIHWLVADVTDAQLERGAYDVWHDRAVFHFLTASEHRAAYVRQVGHAVKPWWPCNRQHIRPRGSRKMQWARRYSV
jgi:hypothetical protein